MSESAAVDVAGTLRLATLADEELLYKWRREQEQTGKREGWYQGRMTGRTSHRSWFRQRFGHVRILIWERGGKPRGYVRLESDGSVAFYPHSLEAVPMLEATHQFANRYGGRLKLVLDRDNRAGSEVAEAAGFEEHTVTFRIYRPW